MKRARGVPSLGAVQQVRPPYLIVGLVVMFALFLTAWYLSTPEITLLAGLGLALVGPPMTVWVQEVIDFNFKERP